MQKVHAVLQRQKFPNKRFWGEVCNTMGICSILYEVEAGETKNGGTVHGRKIYSKMLKLFNR